MVRRLRKGSEKKGLILANGGWLTYQHVICLSSGPRQDGSSYPKTDPLPEMLTTSFPEVDAEAEGEAIIEVSTQLRWVIRIMD